MNWKSNGEGVTYVQVGALETEIIRHSLGGREPDVAAVEVADEHQEHHDGGDETVQLPD